MVEVLAQVMNERDQAQKQAERALDYRSMEPTIEALVSPTTNLSLMSTGLETTEQSKSHGNLSPAPPRTRTLPRKPDTSKHFDELLCEYTKIHKSLVDEIDSEQFNIKQASRDRLQHRNDCSHDLELHRLKFTYYRSRNSINLDVPSAIGSQRCLGDYLSRQPGEDKASLFELPSLKLGIEKKENTSQPEQSINQPLVYSRKFPVDTHWGPVTFQEKLVGTVPAERHTGAESTNFERVDALPLPKASKLRIACDVCQSARIVSMSFHLTNI